MRSPTLTITLQPDWRAALPQAGRRAGARSYQGEVLNFESPGAFFGRMTERRWRSCARRKVKAKSRYES